MRWLAILSVGVLCMMACNSKTSDWLQQYKALKCEYLTTQQQMDEAVKKLGVSVQEQRDRIADSSRLALSSYENKINALQSEIKKAEQDFQKAYKTETLNHSIKYGHVSTPDYENRIKQLETKRDNSIAICESKINTIRRSMETDYEAQAAMSKLQAFDKMIKDKEREVKLPFSKKLDSLQVALNNHNSKFKQILYELNGAEVNKFKAERDSVKLHPCL